MIQIITKNIEKYTEFSKSDFLISKIDEFQSLDNYEITMIDISDEHLWYNKSNDTININQCSDFRTLNSAIGKSKQSKIIIIFPQNIYYHYSYIYKSNGYTYDKCRKIKDFKENFIDIINNNLINMAVVKINYGKTFTRIGKYRYQADFGFINVNENSIEKRAENNNDVTVINNNNILITTLELNSEDEVINLLQDILPDSFNKSSTEPEWIKEIDFYTDSRYKLEISKVDEEIKKLKEKRQGFEANIVLNSKYKSILYESGETLANQVNKMLSEIFEYDLSQFKDIYEEDGCLKLEDVTFIIETKGLNNEISGHNVSDACNHLVIYEDRLEEKKIIENAKCLFLVAYERNKNIQERVEIKDRLIKIAKANNTLIIDTRVFLEIFEDFLNKKTDKDEIKKLLKDNVGRLEYKQK